MRKWIMAIVGAYTILLGLFGVRVEFLADIDKTSIIGALFIIGAYIFTEFKKDWAEFRSGITQTNKYSDPGFWAALISSVLLPLLSLFGVQLGENIIGTVSTILAALVPVLINLFRKTE